MVHNTNSGRLYGSEPKCVRVKEIHRLFYYLVYGYNGDVTTDQATMRELLKSENPDLDDEVVDYLPDLFQVGVILSMIAIVLNQIFSHCRRRSAGRCS